MRWPGLIHHEAMLVRCQLRLLPGYYKRKVVDGETEWQRKDGRGHSLVAGMEKTRSISTDLVGLEVICWPNQL